MLLKGTVQQNMREGEREHNWKIKEQYIYNVQFQKISIYPRKNIGNFEGEGGLKIKPKVLMESMKLNCNF